jgi:hypothetical protein
MEVVGGSIPLATTKISPCNLKEFKFALIPTVVASLTVSACDGSPPHQVCVDPVSRLRIDDARCRGSSSGGSWYYLRSGVSAPGVGESAGNRGSFTPSPGISYSSAPVRGGFGSIGRGFGAGE